MARAKGGAPVSVADALARLDPTLADFPPGEVWLAGAGPGSAGQLTLGTVAARAEAQGCASPALIVVGGIAALRETLKGGDTS